MDQPAASPPEALTGRARSAYLRQELTAPAAALEEYARALLAAAATTTDAETVREAERIAERAQHFSQQVERITAPDAGLPEQGFCSFQPPIGQFLKNRLLLIDPLSIMRHEWHQCCRRIRTAFQCGQRLHPQLHVCHLGYDRAFHLGLWYPASTRQQRLLFEQWRLYKAEELSWNSFRKSIAPIRAEFNSLLLRGRFSGNVQLYGMCEELYSRRDWLWTFTKVKGIEPTNNTAERALRHAVIYRKLSFGTQSASGSRFIERILTVSETCRIQKRSPFEYLVEAMQAHYASETAPSLLPKKEAASAKKAA